MADMTVAKTILAQLGGNKFVVMTGTKNLVGSENSLAFKFGRNSSKSNYVKIVLNGSDLYDITFYHVRNYEQVIDKQYTDIFNDQLVEIFERYTGLRTKLF